MYQIVSELKEAAADSDPARVLAPRQTSDDMRIDYGGPGAVLNRDKNPLLEKILHSNAGLRKNLEELLASYTELLHDRDAWRHKAKQLETRGGSVHEPSLLITIAEYSLLIRPGSLASPRAAANELAPGSSHAKRPGKASHLPLPSGRPSGKASKRESILQLPDPKAEKRPSGRRS